MEKKLLLLLALSFFCIALKSEHEDAPYISQRRADDSPGRQAWLIVNSSPEQTRPAPELGIPSEIYQNLHAALEIASDDGNAQVKIQINSYQDDDGESRYVVEMQDVRDGSTPKPVYLNRNGSPEEILAARTRDVFLLDQRVTASNQELLDPKTGKGILANLWSSNTDYDIITNNCNDFIVKLCARLQLVVPQQLSDAFHGQVEFYTRLETDITAEKVPLSRLGPRNAKNSELFDAIQEFDVTDPQNPVLVRSEGKVKIPLAQRFVQKATVTFRKIKYSLRDFFKGGAGGFGFVPEVSLGPNYFATAGSTSSTNSLPDIDEISTSGGCGGSKRSLGLFSRACSPDEEKYNRLSQADAKELVVTRTNGGFNVMTIFESPTVQAAGIAATVAAVAFIILDFINGDFKAAALSTTSLILGIGVAAEVGGPVGILVGGIVATLFAILPGLFDAKPLPPANNPAMIIQYALFGDRDHTGNEKCNEKRKAQGLAQNCTVVYGAGVLSKVFNWELFDAAIFLIQYNQGHAMRVLDIAAAFHVNDKSKPGDGNDQIATIDCGSQVQPIDQQHPRASAGGRQLPPSVGLPCSPKIAIKREKVKVPYLADTADHIYKRIIPEPGGDCKVLSDPSGGYKSAVSNVTIRGRPIAIACNLTASGEAAGAVNATANYYVQSSGRNGTSVDNNTMTMARTGITSDGSLGRAYQKAPPATPFTALTQDNTTCLIAGTRLCLPAGRYHSQGGKFGFSSSGVKGLLLPSGAKITFSVPTRQAPPLRPRIDLRVYDASMTNGTFATDFKNALDGVFNITLAADPPCICLYDDVDYKGNVQCYGAGGGNLTSPVKSTARSLSVHGGASVWIYAKSYDDQGGALLTTDTSDLGQLAYGNRDTEGKGHDNFSQKVAALWVRSP